MSSSGRKSCTAAERIALPNPTAWIRRNGAQLRLAARMTVACFITSTLGMIFALEQHLWAVLTSIIVMQASVGGSLKAMLDRFLGSLGGAIAGVVISLGLHGLGYASPGLALALGLPPLTVIAALKPAYRVTPITFMILILTPNLQHLGPVESAYERMLEIGLGSLVALAVSLVVLPARAHQSLAQAVAQALAAMAGLMDELPKGLEGEDLTAVVETAHARIRGAIAKAETAADEALRERKTYLSDGVDPLPVCRTLRRLRHDIAILGRTLDGPLPAPVAALLAPPVADLAAAIAGFLTASGQAFAKGLPGPSLAELEARFTPQRDAITAIRRLQLAKGLPDDDLGRIFGLDFAFDQLRRDLVDLSEREAELMGHLAE